MKNKVNRVWNKKLSVSLETLEDRLLMSTNSWKAAVSGNWTDATKWSLGHVPTNTEDVNINVAGDYTVTLNTGYGYGNKVNVGGAAGTQTLAISGTGYLTAYNAVSIQSGDTINVNPGGHIYSYAAANTAATLSGTLTLAGTTTGNATVNLGGANYSGTGSINLATGGTTTYVNSLSLYDGTIGSGITLHGKTADLYGRWTNNGTIKAEGSTSDFMEIDGLTNKGSIAVLNGSTVNFDFLNNTSGKTISINGGKASFTHDFTNAGTITATNVQLKYGMNLKAGAMGTITRTNSPVIFTGVYDGGGKAFIFDAGGKWTWYGGQLTNGTYDPTATNALILDATKSSYGSLNNVSLSNDLSIPAGTYLSVYGNVTLATGKRILLNGVSGKSSGFYMYGAATTLGGIGEVVFNTGGSTAYNRLGGSAGILGGGIVVHGKSGTVSYVTNNGEILADVANEKIEVTGVTNNGNIIAAPGTINAYQFKQNTSGSLTVGIGGTTAGNNQGKFVFADTTSAAALAGTIDIVTLNNFAPANGATFTIASFAKAPTGVFATQNLDAGNGKAFDLTQSTTALTVKAKTVTGAFANRASTGALTITGTANNDVITTKQNMGVLFAAVNGKTSVFFDPQITSEAVRAGAGNDTVTITGARGAYLYGEAGNDSLVGGTGNDSLDGGEGNDTLIGNAGDDSYLFSNAAVNQTDLVSENANSGADTLNFAGETVAVTVNLLGDTLATMTNRTVKTIAAGQYTNIENVIGGSAADKITGNNAANILRGGKGNDTLTGNGGSDSLYGEDDNDTLYGGGDNLTDLLDGGNGTDVKGSADAIDTIANIP